MSFIEIIQAEVIVMLGSSMEAAVEETRGGSRAVRRVWRHVAVPVQDFEIVERIVGNHGRLAKSLGKGGHVPYRREVEDKHPFVRCGKLEEPRSLAHRIATSGHGAKRYAPSLMDHMNDGIKLAWRGHERAGCVQGRSSRVRSPMYLGSSDRWAQVGTRSLGAYQPDPITLQT
ncbi:MAG: hypothetical protein WCE40_05920 [Polyangia bacterium]